MVKMLFSIIWKDGEPSVEQICKEYGFQPQEIDPNFGIIEIDPRDGLYSIRVDQEAALRVRKQLGEDIPDIEGPFADVRIEPFGPPSEL
jgi:hypothetical protein